MTTEPIEVHVAADGTITKTYLDRQEIYHGDTLIATVLPDGKETLATGYEPVTSAPTPTVQSVQAEATQLAADVAKLTAK